MANYLFDTCSLIALVRYYLPFDKNNVLRNFIYSGFKSKEFLMLKQVQSECKQVSNGLVFSEFTNLKHIKPVNFNEVITDKFHRLIDNNFIVSQSQINKLESGEYEIQKQKFIESADFNLIYCAMENNHTIITEETPINNDNKLFKKIPTICQIQEIKCISISQLLQTRLDINFAIKSTMENINSL
ncbi:DUF4411 family protein [Helicobacter sp. 23-1044]